MNADVIKRRICTALMVPDDCEDWLERAEHQIHAYREMTADAHNPPALDLETLGGRIQAAREVLGLSRPQLAARMGITEWLMERIEKGERDLPGEKFGGLCLSLGVTRAWLLGDSEEGGPPLPREVMRMLASPAWHRYKRHMRALRQDYRRREKGLAELNQVRAEVAERKSRLR